MLERFKRNRGERKYSELRNNLDAEFSRLNIAELLGGLQRDVWGGGKIESPNYTLSAEGGQIYSELIVRHFVHHEATSYEENTMPGAGYWIGNPVQIIDVPAYEELQVLQSLGVEIGIDTNSNRSLILISKGGLPYDKRKPNVVLRLNGSENDLKRLQEAIDNDTNNRLTAGIIPITEAIKNLAENR